MFRPLFLSFLLGAAFIDTVFVHGAETTNEPALQTGTRKAQLVCPPADCSGSSVVFMDCKPPETQIMSCVREGDRKCQWQSACGVPPASAPEISTSR
jgi:hypothetical protein